MNRVQKYLSVLLERLPKWELRSYEHQTSLDRIRDKVTSAPDLKQELTALYQVKGFSEFALSLMWIAGKVERDATLDESTLSEETFVFEKLRAALGDGMSSQDAPASSGEPEDFSAPAESAAIVPPVPLSESPFETAAPASFDSPFSGLTFGEASPPAPEPSLNSWGMASESSPVTGGSGAVNDEHFANLMERFLESIQSGSDDRSALMSEVLSECQTITNSLSSPEEYKQFCGYLTEFLQYITANQFLDDIRVMNIVSNIQDPLSQWARTDQSGRGGILDPALEILRDFKSMFE